MLPVVDDWAYDYGARLKDREGMLDAFIKSSEGAIAREKRPRIASRSSGSASGGPREISKRKSRGGPNLRRRGRKT
jgi:hypothetical protein